jgi:negative regulator of replication initiation
MPTWYLALQAASAVLGMSSLVYTWRSSQQAAARTALESVRTKCDENEHQIVKVLEAMRHLPTSDEIANLQRDVGRLLERTSNLNGWLETTNRKLDRIDDWLRENK